MIRSTKELQAAVDNFADTSDLAKALRNIAEKTGTNLDGSDSYYLNEAAIHLNSMHDLLREISRALKARDGPES